MGFGAFADRNLLLCSRRRAGGIRKPLNLLHSYASSMRRHPGRRSGKPQRLGLRPAGDGGCCRCGVCRGYVAHCATLDSSFDEWLGASGAGPPRFFEALFGRQQGIRHRHLPPCHAMLTNQPGYCSPPSGTYRSGAMIFCPLGCTPAIQLDWCE